MVHEQLGTSTNGGGTAIGAAQLGAATTGCGYNWVRLQPDAAQLGAEQLGAAQLGRIQLGAPTTEYGYNWVRLQPVAATMGAPSKRILKVFNEDCLAANKGTSILLQYSILVIFLDKDMQ